MADRPTPGSSALGQVSPRYPGAHAFQHSVGCATLHTPQEGSPGVPGCCDPGRTTSRQPLSPVRKPHAPARPRHAWGGGDVGGLRAGGRPFCSRCLQHDGPTADQQGQDTLLWAMGWEVMSLPCPQGGIPVPAEAGAAPGRVQPPAAGATRASMRGTLRIWSKTSSRFHENSGTAR